MSGKFNDVNHWKVTYKTYCKNTKRLNLVTLSFEDWKEWALSLGVPQSKGIFNK